MKTQKLVLLTSLTALILGLFVQPSSGQPAQQMRELLISAVSPEGLAATLADELRGIDSAELNAYLARLEGLASSTPKGWPGSLWELQVNRARAAIFSLQAASTADSLQAESLLSKSLEFYLDPDVAVELARRIAADGNTGRALGLLLSCNVIRPAANLVDEAERLHLESGYEKREWNEYLRKFSESYQEMVARSLFIERQPAPPELAGDTDLGEDVTVIALWDESMHRLDAAGLRDLQSTLLRRGQHLQLIYCGSDLQLGRQRASAWGLDLPSRDIASDAGLRDVFELTDAPAIFLLREGNAWRLDAPNRAFTETLDHLNRLIEKAETVNQDGLEE